MRKVFINLLNYSTCEDCAFHLVRDVLVFILIYVLGYFTYPAPGPAIYFFYRVLWFLWNSFYIYLVVHHVFMICYPNSPPIMMQLAWRLRGRTFIRQLYWTMKKTVKEDQGDLYHFHGESVEEVLKRAEKGEEITNMVLDKVLAFVFNYFLNHYLLLDLILSTGVSLRGKEKQRAHEHEQDAQRTHENEQDTPVLRNSS